MGNFSECADEVLAAPLLFGNFRRVGAVREEEDPRLYEDLGSYRSTKKLLDTVRLCVRSCVVCVFVGVCARGLAGVLADTHIERCHSTHLPACLSAPLLTCVSSPMLPL